MLIKKIFTFTILPMIFVAIASCTQSVTQQPENAMARVGNKYLTLDEAVSSIPQFLLKQDSLHALRQYRDEWVQKQLLLQEANRLSLSSNEHVQRRIKKAREEVLRNALKEHVLKSNREKLAVSDEEARNYYQANKSKFTLDEEFVQFRHLTTNTLKEARAAKQDLLGGVPWPEVARQYGLDPESAIEQSEQFWPISMALSNIDIMNRYLNVIGQQEISPIQRVNGVYHFVQLMESRAKGEMPDLEWLIEKIKNWMLMNKQRQNFSSYTKNLYLKAESNNEVETFNVIPSETNQNSISEDTLQSNSTNE